MLGKPRRMKGLLRLREFRSSDRDRKYWVGLPQENCSPRSCLSARLLDIHSSPCLSRRSVLALYAGVRPCVWRGVLPALQKSWRPCVWRPAILPLQKSCGPRGAELFLSEKDPPPPGWGTLAFESVGALWFEGPIE